MQWQRNAAYWLAPHGFLSLLPYTIQDYLGVPRGGTTCGELVPPISLIDQENALQTCLQAHFVEVSSLFCSLFSDGWVCWLKAASASLLSDFSDTASAYFLVPFLAAVSGLARKMCFLQAAESCY